MKLSLFLLMLSFQIEAYANHLTLYFIHSPVGINWKTPRTLAQSVVNNSIVPVGKAGRFPIGHLYAEISCPQLNYYEKTGQTSTGTEDEDRILKYAWGLGSMIDQTTGILDTTQTVDRALKHLYKKGRVAFLKVLLSDSACSRLVDYMNEYRALSLDKIYAGLHARPLHKEGSGCSAFGASLLEINNLLLPSQRSAWSRQLVIPYRYIGGPRTGQKVSLMDMLTAFGSKWGNPSDTDGILIDFFEPDLMYKWVKDEYKKVQKGMSLYQNFPVDISLRQKAKGLIFDMRQFVTPTGPLFR